MTIKQWTLILLSLSFLPLLNAAEQKSNTSNSSGELPEVIIKGGEKSGVKSEKPPLEIDLEADEPLQPVLDPDMDILQRQPESLRNPSAGFATFLYNKNVILPGRVRLAKDPVKVFYPLRDILAISPAQFQEIGSGWEMTITDSQGHSFRKFSAKGLPPANITWNGRSERGEIVTVGKNYSVVINYKDTRGQTRTYVGDPFVFDGVLHQEANGILISLAIPALFKGGGRDAISESGMDLLREAADWIKRYYFTYPLKIEGHSKDGDAGIARAKATAKALQSLLILTQGEIPSDGFPSDINSERIDIVIANR